MKTTIHLRSGDPIVVPAASPSVNGDTVSCADSNCNVVLINGYEEIDLIYVKKIVFEND